MSVNITVASTVGGSFTVGGSESSSANLTVSGGVGPQGVAGPQGLPGPVFDVVGGTGLDAANNSGNITLALNASLGMLSDVSVSGASAGQVLTFSGSTWVASAGGGGGGTGDLTVNMDVPPKTGEVLKWDGSAWVPSHDETGDETDSPAVVLATGVPGGGIIVSHNRGSSETTLLVEVYEVPSIPFVYLAEQDGVKINVQAEVEHDAGALSLKISDGTSQNVSITTYQDLGVRGDVVWSPPAHLRSSGSRQVQVGGVVPGTTSITYSPPFNLTYTALPFWAPTPVRVWSDPTTGEVVAIAAFSEDDLERTDIDLSQAQVFVEVSVDDGQTWARATTATPVNYSGRDFQGFEFYSATNQAFRSGQAAAAGLVQARVVAASPAGSGYTAAVTAAHDIYHFGTTDSLPSDIETDENIIVCRPVSVSMTPAPPAGYEDGALVGGGSNAATSAATYFANNSTWIEYLPGTAEFYDGTTQRSLTIVFEARLYGPATKSNAFLAVAIDNLVSTNMSFSVSDSVGVISSFSTSNGSTFGSATLLMDKGETYTVAITVDGEQGVRGVTPTVFAQIIPQYSWEGT